MHTTNHREIPALVTNASAAFKAAIWNPKVYYQTSTIIESKACGEWVHSSPIQYPRLYLIKSFYKRQSRLIHFTLIG